MTIPVIADLDRYRIFALVEALESDLRAIIRDYLVEGTGSLPEGLGSYYGKALARSQEDTDEVVGGVRLWEYLDLGDEVDLLNERRDLLPEVLASAVRTASSSLKEVVPVRHRVMHRRPLLPDDVDRLLRALESASAAGIEMPNVNRVSMAIRANAQWLPGGVEAVEPDEAKALHNLPLPEYDETGLIGRRGESEDLLSALLRRRYPVLTVLGPGGAGKTAGTVALIDRWPRESRCAVGFGQIASASSSNAAATRRWRVRASTPSS